MDAFVPQDMTQEKMLKHGTLFVHAPAGHGKSTLALTLSDDCPEDWYKPREERVWLEDLFYISVDSKGYAGFYGLNVVPRYILDVDELMSNPEMYKSLKFPAAPSMSVAFEFALDEAEKWLKEHPNGKLVIDTLSALHKGLLVEFKHQNTMRQYGQVKNWHLSFHSRMKHMNFDKVLYLAHSKAAFKAEASDQTKASWDAGKTLDSADIIPDLDGSADVIYKNESLFEGFIDTVTPPGSKERKRYFYITKHKGKEAKNRFEHIKGTNGKLEPHLGKLLQVITKG